MSSIHFSRARRLSDAVGRVVRLAQSAVFHATGLRCTSGPTVSGTQQHHSLPDPGLHRHEMVARLGLGSLGNSLLGGTPTFSGERQAQNHGSLPLGGGYLPSNLGALYAQQSQRPVVGLADELRSITSDITDAFTSQRMVQERDQQQQMMNYPLTAKLITACGCERLLFVDQPTRIIQRTFRVGRPQIPNETDWMSGSQAYQIRRFRYDGERDYPRGSYIYREIIGENEDLYGKIRVLEQRYKQLWESIYGVDEGL